MELQLSDEQQAFVETTRRFVGAECPISAVRELEHEPAGFDAAVWRLGAELGWTSLLVAEAHGGGCLSEHGLSDLVLVAEELGRAVGPGPLVPVNVVAEAVSRHGSAHQRATVLPGLLDGTEVAAWCGTDLVEARTDLSLVADVVRDAAQTRRLDTNRLKELLGPLAARNGLRKGDGAALLDETPKVGVNGFRSMSHRMASRWISLDVVRFVRDR